MTATQDGSRRGLGLRGSRRPEPAGDDGSGSLADLLVAARERKGVDLYRAERETKIRARYLAALERGDYRELPGAVYTRGFLRNYALYLGLDADEVVARWQRESGARVSADPVVIGPRALEAPRRRFVISRGMFVAALLALSIVAFLGYLGLQLFRFAQPPTLAVTSPDQAVVTVSDSTTAFVVRGTASAGATVAIDAPGRDTQRVTADEEGSWASTVELRPGKNQFDVSATDPKTGKRTADPIRILITVPIPDVAGIPITIAAPADGARSTDGRVTVVGSAPGARAVAVVAARAGTADSSPGPSSAPAGSEMPTGSPRPAVTGKPAADGSFSIPLQLPSGRWVLSITATGDAGRTGTTQRVVTVGSTAGAPSPGRGGVTVVVSVRGGRAWIKAWVDGKLSSQTGVGRTLNDGQSVTLAGNSSVEVRTGSSGVTSFTVNGKDLGTLGRSGIPETWLFASGAAPRQTGRR